MAKRPSSDGASWSASELKTLKKLAANGTAAQAAKALGRANFNPFERFGFRLLGIKQFIRLAASVDTSTV